MDDALKVLIGAGAGFVAGLLGEAVKFPLMQRLKRRQLRHTLYKDLALIRISLRVSHHHYEHDHQLEKNRMRTFHYLYTTDRMTFCLLPTPGKPCAVPYLHADPGLHRGE